MDKYGVLYVDPPWKFQTYSPKGITHRSADSRYQTMGISSLAELPVADLAAKDCAMFMWVVDSHLDQGIALMRSWGFNYRTIAFVWVKVTKAGQPRMSMGLWTRKMSEVCLMGTVGKPKRISKSVRQVIMAPLREHSRKPDIYDRIEALVAGPFCEIFARQRYPGWDTAFSNEQDKFQCQSVSTTSDTCATSSDRNVAAM